MGISLSRLKTTATVLDPQAVEQRLARSESFGLFNICERLEALGGRLKMEKGPGGGAHFRMIVPWTQEATPAEDAPCPSEQERAPLETPPAKPMQSACSWWMTTPWSAKHWSAFWTASRICKWSAKPTTG